MCDKLYYIYDSIGLYIIYMIVLVYACTIHKLGPGVDVNGSDIKGLDLIIFFLNYLSSPLSLFLSTQDRVRYCIMTYNRALDGKHFLADPSLKEEVSSATQQAAAAMIVQILTEGVFYYVDFAIVIHIMYVNYVFILY